jgi:hypothetical protein
MQPPLHHLHLIENQGKSGGDIHQKWRYYLYWEVVSPPNDLQNYAQIYKSGGSGDGEDFFRLYLGSIRMNSSTLTLN